MISTSLSDFKHILAYKSTNGVRHPGIEIFGTAQPRQNPAAIFIFRENVIGKTEADDG